MLRSRRLWLGIAVSALFVALLLRRVDGGELLETLRGVRPGWLVPAAAAYMAGIWMRALRWRLVLAPSLAVARREVLVLILVGYAANSVLPVRAGELVRAGLLKQRHGASLSLGLGTIVVERVLDGLVLAAFLVVTIALAGGSTLLRGLALLAGAGFVVAALLLALLVARPRQGAALAERLGGALPRRLRARALGWLRDFVEGLTTLRGGAVWARVCAVSVASWALEAATYWLVGLAFGLDLPPLLYLGLTGAANLALSAPSTAGGVGPFEFFAAEVAIAHGTAVSVATAYAIALHALLLVPLALLGLWVAGRRGLGLRALSAAAGLERAAESPTADGEAEIAVRR